MEPPARSITEAADISNESDTSDLPSCEGCRKRKLKCSRQLPLCANCERLDVTCVYDGKKTKPGVKSGAVESLNRRLETVENALLARQKELSDQNRNQDDSGVTQQSAQPAPWATSFQSEQSQVVDVLSSLSKEIKSLGSAITSSSLLRKSWEHQQQNETEHRELSSKRKRVDGAAPIATQPTYYGQLNNSKTVPGDYFSSSLRVAQLDSLLEVFFNRVQPWVPMLHVDRFPRIMRDPSQRQEKSILLHAIQVVTLRLLRNLDDSPLDPEYVAREVKSSRDFVILSAMDGLSVENLQALTLIAFSDIGNGDPQKAWPIIGSLTRTVEYLHLTVEPEDYKPRGGLLKPTSTLSQPKDWIEQEERRRVFWNIFNLDRFCSVTTGSNTSLTAADVCRRLPVCGGIWYAGKPEATPYFGIWDRAAARIGNSITFLPEHYPSPSQTIGTSPGMGKEAYTPRSTEVNQHAKRPHLSSGQSAPDMSNVGAFAYYIESLESLSRIMTYFLQQDVDFKDRQQLTAWLTRFKELDLRLVHWKMFLPHEWKDSGMSRETMPGVMDPNMTIAHTTHNTSMILLHQRIAYPTKELMTIKLPSLYSAETCQSAATETATITKSYLELSSPETIVSPQMAFAAFVSARVLLVHANYYDNELALEFWSLISNLDEMHSRWIGPQHNNENATLSSSLFSQFATRLRGIYERLQKTPSLTIDVSGQFDDLTWEEELLTPGNQVSESSPSIVSQSRGSNLGRRHQEGIGTHGMSHKASEKSFQPSGNGLGTSQPWLWPQTVQPNPLEGGVPNREPDDLSAISQVLMDQQFMDMDRVISFEDVMHTSWDTQGGTSLEPWRSTQDEQTGSAADNNQSQMY